LEKNETVALLGATSMVGSSLLNQLALSRQRVIAFSRRSEPERKGDIEWRKIDSSTQSNVSETIPSWICLAPIWMLPNYFQLLENSGAKRIVVLSSTSIFTKMDSLDLAEQALARKLMDSEAQLKVWAESRGIEWVVVRPTLIYGLGLDKNITEIMRFILRWGFFPVLGSGKGLRQPVRVEDVAKACKAVIDSSACLNGTYNLSGAEILSYREMLARVFVSMGRKQRLIHFPRWFFQFMLLGLRIVPVFRNWSIGMVDRMSRDMIFDHSDFETAFKLSPQPFVLNEKDLPKER
jgi:nucleoside-diphosphate-sugar epimerase